MLLAPEALNRAPNVTAIVEYVAPPFEPVATPTDLILLLLPLIFFAPVFEELIRSLLLKFLWRPIPGIFISVFEPYNIIIHVCLDFIESLALRIILHYMWNMIVGGMMLLCIMQNGFTINMTASGLFLFIFRTIWKLFTIEVILTLLELIILTFVAYILWYLVRISKDVNAPSPYYDIVDKCYDLYAFFQNHTSIKMGHVPDLEREQFINLPFPTVFPPSNHTHASSAKDRQMVSTFVDTYAAALCKVPYYIQRRNRDIQSNRAGSNIIYWSKDSNTESTSIEIEPNHLIVMIHVDFHADMHYLLQRYYGHTWVLFTFLPETVASSDKEFSFTFNSKAEVVFHFSGSASYKHRVWNWWNDTVTVRRGIFLDTYLVVRRKIAPHSYIVLLTPFSVTVYLPEYTPLTYFDPVIGDDREFVVINSRTTDVHKVTIGKVGCHVFASMTVNQFDSLHCKSNNAPSKIPISVPQVLSNSDISKEAVDLAVSYYRNVNKISGVYVFPVEHSVHRVQWNEYVPEARPSIHPWCSPIIDGCYAPDMTFGNDLEYVRKRILLPQASRIAATDIPMRYHVWGKEFTDWMFEELGPLVPVDLETVFDHQKRPTQRRILEEALMYGNIELETVRYFMKRESYSKPKAPRPIGQEGGAVKIVSSMIHYAIAEVMESFDWYAGGMTPISIATKVTSVCTGADVVNCTDLKEYDGSLDEFLNLLTGTIFKQCFEQSYADGIIIDQLATAHRKAKTKEGNSFLTKFNQISGRNDTPTANSIKQLGLIYYALRVLGYDHDMACYTLKNHTIVLGDDGLCRMEARGYEKVASDFNLKLESFEVRPTDYHTRVTFLSRIYPREVFFSSPNSCADLPRALSKVHTSTLEIRNPVMAREKGYMKALSIFLMDPNTPLLSWWAKKVIKDCSNEFSNKTFEPQTWNARHDASVQYPNENIGNWMEEYVQDVLPDFNADALWNWSTSSSACGNVLFPPLCLERIPPPITEEVIIDREVHTKFHQTGQLKNFFNFARFLDECESLDKTWLIYTGAYGPTSALAIAKLCKEKGVHRLTMFDGRFRGKEELKEQITSLTLKKKFNVRVRTEITPKIAKEMAKDKVLTKLYVDDIYDASPRKDGTDPRSPAEQLKQLKFSIEIWKDLNKPRALLKLPLVACKIPDGVVWGPPEGLRVWENRLQIMESETEMVEYNGEIGPGFPIEPYIPSTQTVGLKLYS